MRRDSVGGFICYGRLAFHATEIGNSKMQEIPEIGVFKSFFSAINRTPVNDKNLTSRARAHQDVIDMTADPSEAEHLTYTIAGQFSCGTVADFADIGRA